MRDLLIVTHGKFGEELIKSAAMIIGENESIHAISLMPEEGPTDLQQKIEQLIDQKPTLKDAIVMADLLGGTPCNVLLRMMDDHPNWAVYSGVNLPMILSFVNQQFLESEEDRIMADGKEGIVDIRVLKTSLLMDEDE
ncbi:PTS sugar transporter subunit IIA [Listeria costaricensis]|uniref:PTS sugar transporter subunit IIA n=1 Tax=Listeria costaricensis TaxID=2026604 RepID=UPI000C07E8B4|nr:PTS sugar transporter subunit IIA [Listeria costaricensis]